MIPKEKSQNSQTGDFRFKKIGQDYLIVNNTGSWLFLKETDFNTLTKGKITPDHELFPVLNKNGFLEIKDDLLGEQISRFSTLNNSLFQGPSLFIIVLTMRCNLRCLYCQVTPENLKAKNRELDQKTAKKIVDTIFKSPAKSIRIEFQGGEPLLNWPILEYIVKYAHKVNAEVKKNLIISLISNLTLLDDDKLKFLLKNEVALCCSLDGPAEVHDQNRQFISGQGSHAILNQNIAKAQQAIAKENRKDTHKGIKLDAVLTVSRFSLPYHREIVDEYRRLGFDHLFLRPLSSFGLAKETWQTIGYVPQDYINFYRKILDYILEVNEKGELFIERGTLYLVKKILKGEDAYYLDMKSPCGAVTGQLAFDYNGDVYTCDEGRMAARMGIDSFKLGSVHEDEYNDLIDNETAKITCLSSLLDNHVSCYDCPYKPFCGTCPIANLVDHRTLFPIISNTERCQINQAIFDYLFSKLKDKKYEKIFLTWLDKK